MSNVKRSISTASAATLVVTVIIIIVIGTYATLNFSSGGSETSTTCNESTTTFTVIQNGTTQDLSYLIPASQCQRQVSLSGFSLQSAGSSPGLLSGNVSVVSPSPLTTFLLYVNGTYELFNDFALSSGSSPIIQYNAVLSNATVPIITGLSYSIEFVAIFGDGTATTATTLVTATA
jgi:hypothetical protein